MARFIGIRHRVKKTAAGEARPTQVVILHDGKTTKIDLPDDQAELDFVRTLFPKSYRAVKPTDNLAIFLAHHLQWKKAKNSQSAVGLPEGFVCKVGKDVMILDKVPAIYEGLQAGDVVGMVLGGSGDRLAAALSRRGEHIGATVWRVPPKDFSFWRGEASKDEDANLLAQMVRDRQSSFYQVENRDRDLIRVGSALRARQEAMQARIACAQRLRASFIGSVFLSEEGFFPEGQIDNEFILQSSNNVVLQNLAKEERLCDRELEKAVKATALWDNIFAPIEGVGPRLAAAFISGIVDVRRFSSEAKLKKFCGAHVLEDGSFPRRRRGQVANWSPDLRQALFLLGDQFNRRPDSPWGMKLRDYKVKLRAKHPEPVVVDGTKHYSDGHIHRMATWRTLTKFVEWLYSEWWKLEIQYQESRVAA